MECENTEELISDSSGTDKTESIDFHRVTSVASGWMLDFMFVSLCRSFKEGNFDEFNETLSVFKELSQCKSLHADVNDEKSLICAFLARVIHGKQLDAQFEDDESVMPLMSAVMVWSSLEDAVEDEQLFENINVLLLVQAVAVCLEKGQRSSANSALKWFEKRQKCSRNLGVKLSTIVTKMETYHPFLMSFSFSRLLESIQSFLDSYLKRNPSDFIFKAATSFVQYSPNVEDSTPAALQDSSPSKPPSETRPNNKKTKRRLLSTKTTDVWSPDTTKKPCVSIRRLSRKEVCQLMARKSSDTAKSSETVPPQEYKEHNNGRTRRKWTAQLDKYLKEGVWRHGRGNWAKILLDYDFEGRTSTNLKDRWRILCKTYKVD
ncbi:telomeric repeat-binding factor 1 [Fundulus heteroclitus]|uniref:telomeric repeat-binding factor 1 n=1 Tax=Fundulus heteroclitus TaxID=8078 RepID=UPI00165BB5C3|nr:telomeric repeat-binding factor 1 [Fundulus heteroclitus]